jgi:hypothetical protein
VTAGSNTPEIRARETHAKQKERPKRN